VTVPKLIRSVLVNVPLIVRVPKLSIKPVLLTELGIVTVCPGLICLSSASPGTPGLFISSSQVLEESQDPLLTEEKDAAYASSSVPTNPRIKILTMTRITHIPFNAHFFIV